MTRWSKTLPIIRTPSLTHAARYLASAIEAADRGSSPAGREDFAAAHIRAYRLGRAAQGSRVEDYPPIFSDETLRTRALYQVAGALDMQTVGRDVSASTCLRHAEACLRTLRKRRQGGAA